ncbi:MAG: YicC family protein [Clostridia bacterium]|nr:YicC family protein [Clostridia bacterium]
MIKSMSAFGRARLEGEARSITVEIKSVNSRFFDPTVKLPRGLLYLEEKIKARLQARGISRGKVDVFVTVENHVSDIGDIQVDFEYAEKYIAALRSLGEKFSLRDDISIMSVARTPDIFTFLRTEADAEDEWAELCSVLDRAIDSHSEMRIAEGERIRTDIEAKVENIRAYAVEVESISLSDTVGYRAKLEDRLRKILADNSVVIDENRLLTECAVWADKIAIDEELVRLRSHFDAFYEIAALPEPSGKKLDYLIQEFNRETNTIGSKANNARIARIVVDMKGEIEKIREQVQNIE